jgi:hypothetical protein
MQQFASFKPKTNAREKAAFATYAFEILSFKHAQGDPENGQRRRERIVKAGV